MKYLTYGWYLTKHRCFVMMACFRRGLIWRGLKHDLSKYSPTEWSAYAQRFYGKEKKTNRDKTGYYPPNATSNPKYRKAWLHHVHKNDHHWQHYCLVNDADTGGVIVLPMSKNAVKEMICDWIGAGKAQKNPTTCKEWFHVNKVHMHLHTDTELLIRQYLAKWFII